MARVCVWEPVGETRELLERLVERLGHEVVLADEVHRADALLFEPHDHTAVTAARALRALNPSAALVACAATPDEAGEEVPAGLSGVVRLLQPFAPEDLRRALSGALVAH